KSAGTGSPRRVFLQPASPRRLPPGARASRERQQGSLLSAAAGKQRLAGASGVAGSTERGDLCTARGWDRRRSQKKKPRCRRWGTGQQDLDSYDTLRHFKTRKQLALKLPRRGGKRRGAGRKPNGPMAGVHHLTRARVRRGPVHVNWHMRQGTWNLRQFK